MTGSSEADPGSGEIATPMLIPDAMSPISKRQHPDERADRAERHADPCARDPRGKQFVARRVQGERRGNDTEECQKRGHEYKGEGRHGGAETAVAGGLPVVRQGLSRFLRADDGHDGTGRNVATDDGAEFDGASAAQRESRRQLRQVDLDQSEQPRNRHADGDDVIVPPGAAHNRDRCLSVSHAPLLSLTLRPGPHTVLCHQTCAWQKFISDAR